MKTTTLRELISESIQGYIREIDMVSEIAAIESKIAEAGRAMEERNNKLAEAEKLNESGLIDEKKVKQLQKEVALLEKYKAKQEALLEKKKAKNKGKGKEVDDEMITEEPMEEIDGLEEMYYEEGDSMEEGKEEMKEESLNESFLRMQKLAGVITETQYNNKKRLLSEGFYAELSGWTSLGNKDKQKESGFVEGDKVAFDTKNTKTGEVIETVEGIIDGVYYKDNQWAVVMKKKSGNMIFSTDTSKFADIKRLRKI